MACIGCHYAKRKCTYHINQVKCERCTLKKIECTPHISQQGRRNDLLDVDGNRYSDRLLDVIVSQERDKSPTVEFVDSAIDINDTSDDVDDDDNVDDDDDIEDDDCSGHDDCSAMSSSHHLNGGFVFGGEDSSVIGSNVFGFGYYDDDCNGDDNFIFGNGDDNNCEDDNSDCQVISKVMLKLPGTCKGKRSVFEVGYSNNLKRYDIDGRCIIPLDGPVSFIQSTSHSHFTQNCMNHSIVYREISSDNWRYAISFHLVKLLRGLGIVIIVCLSV